MPPFHTQTAEMRAMARHCSVGIELRMCAERIILLDTQVYFRESVSLFLSFLLRTTKMVLNHFATAN